MNQRERKQAAILAAAISEFQEKGFQGSSMDAISLRAKVSKRTVYNHFENKEALFQVMVQQLFELSAEQQDYRYYADQSLKQQLSTIAERKIKLFNDPHMNNLVRVIFSECIHSPTLVQDALQKFQQQELGLESWISAAIADNRLKKVDPHYASEQFMGLIKSVTFWPQLLMNQPLPEAQQCQKIIDDSVSMFLNFYQC
ncbi:TetR/AcrR family transcriptional regulator [Amphritea sp.]|uniref:TetR/AcrR family transcriptional regulator n=1 Tax=Amphritea sp. TaxID=1872502 RepID=UPI003A926E10